MDIWINVRSNVRIPIADLVTCVLLYSLVNHMSTYANEDRDRRLAEKFAPILILTENPTPRGDYAVINPEPVEIVGANHISNLWLTAYDFSSTPELSAPFLGDWNPPLPHALMRSAFPKVDFSQNKFAFITADKVISYTGLLPGRAIPATHFLRFRYFDYPGDGRESWEDAYFPKEGANDAYAGKRFPNTVYFRVFERDSSDNYGSVLIKYYCFYPFNDWENNHEGDWTRINVVVTSLDPDEAEIHGVDYKFHGKGISYFNITNHPSKHNIRQTIAPVGGQYPVVYVSAGGHGHFPTPGHYEDAGRVGVDEDLTPYGVVLHPEIVASDKNKKIAQSYNLVWLPEPVKSLDNMGLDPEMSWLGAEVQWGTPRVLSWPGSDHEAPLGPYYSGWNKIHYESEKRRDYLNLDIPYYSFHNFPIVGDVRWRGEISLLGDIVVFPGATLTIEPGTVIEYAPKIDIHQFPAGIENQSGFEEFDPILGLAEIFVYGTLKTESPLVVTGTESDSIFFQRESVYGPTEAWGGVHVMDGGSTLLNEYTRLSDTRRGRPAGLTAEPDEEPGTVVLAWSNPDRDRSIPWWEYRQQTGSAAWGPWTRMQGSGWNTTTHTVEKLTGGVAYQFQVRGLNRTDLAESEVVAAIPVGFPIEGLAQIEYAENRADVVATYTVPGAAGDAIRWSLAGEGDFIATDDDFFAINGSGQLRFQEPPNYEQPLDDDEGGPNTYHIEIRATPFTGRPASAEASFSALFSAFQGLSAAASAGKASAEAPSSTRTKAVVVTVTDGDDAGMVALPSTARVGQSLTAELVDEDADLTDMVWTWWADGDDVRTASGDTTDSYEPQSADEGRRLQAQVRYNDPFGAKTVVSAPTAAVQPAGVITLSPDPPRMCQPVTAELSGPNKVSGETWTWERRRPNSNNWDVLGSSSSSASSKKAAPSDFANLFNAFNSGSGKRSRYEPRSQDRDWLLRATVSWDGHEVSSADSAPVRANVPWPPRWCFLGERPITAAQPSPATSTSIGWPRKRNGTRLGRPSTAARRRQPVTRPRGSP